MRGTTFDGSRLVNQDGLKAEIAAALPISAVAERLADVELVASGHQRKGLCPLHEEDSPSFYVNDAKGLFNCFGCKTGGDSITLVREVHNVGYHEALVLLADAAGVDIQRFVRPATAEEKAKDELRDWCEDWLSTRATASRVDAAIEQEFGVGLRAEPHDKPPYLKGKGYWLTGTVFPYRALSGKLVGWKTRGFDKKMFGTPQDFPLAEPVVYGLDIARHHVTDGHLIVVEGEYDCLTMHEHGIRDCAAIGGSAWTDQMMEILVEAKIKRVTFLLDGDEGGLTVARSIAQRFWRHKVDVRIAQAWPGADPEDMLRSFADRSVIDSLVAGARGAFEWLLWQEWTARPRPNMSAKLEFVRWVQAEYGEKIVGMEQAITIKHVAEWMGLPDADVLDIVRASKTLLQAVDSEKVVLGRCLRDQGYYTQTRKRISMTDFYVLKHQRLWKALEDMLAAGLDWDAVAARAHGANAGVEDAYIDLLMETGDLNIGWHEDQVIDYAVRRGAQADADRFREVIADLNVPANQQIGALTHSVTSKALGRGSGAFRGIVDQVDEAMETLHARMRNPTAIHGIDLGSQFPLLARNLQGLQPRRLVLVAAVSGKGKSTLTLQWVTALAVHQAIPVDFISLEMDTDEILFKQCSHLTGIDSLKISGGDLEPQEAKRVEAAMLRIRKSPLRIYAPDGICPSEFVLYARESVMERRTEVFVLDYAQMVGPDPEDRRLSRYEQLGTFAYTAKQKVARGLDTTVIACAQLKREAAGKEEPTPEDMGDSYELVRAADVILLINENDSKASELWIGKNRQGPGQLLIPTQHDKPSNTFREHQGAKEPDYRILTA